MSSDSPERRGVEQHPLTELHETDENKTLYKTHLRRETHHVPPIPRNSKLILVSFMSLEVTRALFAEAMYVLSPHRKSPFVTSTLIVFGAELIKFLVSFIIVLCSTQNFSLDKLLYFLPSAGLYYINNALYYWILKETSTGMMSLLLHLRIPITALVHHFIIKREHSPFKWVAVVGVFIGIVIAQIKDNLEFTSPLVTGVAILISINSAFASVINEKLLKSLEMPFWDQQLRMYFLGMLVSMGSMWKSNGWEVREVDPRVLPSLITVTAGCIIAGALSGLSTGYLVYRLDNVVKVIANAVNTVLITTLGFLIFGLFNFKLINFIIGTLILLAGSYFYSLKSSDWKTFSIAKPNGKSWSPQSLKLKSAVLVLFLVLSIVAGSLILQYNAVWGQDISKQTPIQDGQGLVASPETVAPLNDNQENPQQYTHQGKTVTYRMPETNLEVLRRSNLTVVMYASRATTGFCRTIRSVIGQNLTLFIAGYGKEDTKTDKPYKFLEISELAKRDLPESHVLIFMDGYDIIAQQDEKYILQEFSTFKSGIVYAAEKGCWPFNQDSEAEREICPLFPAEEAVKKIYKDGFENGQPTQYLNSGWMACKRDSCPSWFKDSLETKPKYFTDDDQAIAAMTCHRYGPECVLDNYSKMVQCMYWSLEDVEFIENRWRNIRSQSFPAFLHFNGDKAPFSGMDKYSAASLDLLSQIPIYLEHGKVTSFDHLCAPYMPYISPV